MTYSLYDRLLRREVADSHHSSRSRRSPLGRNDGPASYANVRGLYGDQAWVSDLDIVNELGGHTGCVNALSWSKSGRLLASGSDDTHLNIHVYQPENSASPFNLSTTIATGHTANIFSVKFMPHSNDSTLVSCAGDSHVRVFDIEYSGAGSRSTHISPSSARHHSGVNLEELYRGVQFLGPGTTNGRVYKSHGDRAKRIVTESSPHLFLTCSEDGEVRQWDLRLPSSAYPSPRGIRGATDPNIPPPLISYKHFRLDLNTISCSGSQPHYIVLGGAHLHAFLHDRRMLGRDGNVESGASGSLAQGDDAMDRATRCVRRFAPNGKKKMLKSDSGHITACKISDARPDEMIGSWSGDYIYSFNLVKSPDVREADSEDVKKKRPDDKVSRTKESKDRNRKRGQPSSARPSSTSAEGLARGVARARSAGQGIRSNGDVALRVRYGNGQSEDIPLQTPTETLEQVREERMTASQRRSLRIAEGIGNIRKLFFSLSESKNVQESSDISAYTSDFSDILGRASALLPEMKEISTSWGYPLSPSHDMVVFQQTLRKNRSTSCDFVQAAGSLARVLGGKVRTLDPASSESVIEAFITPKTPKLYDEKLSAWQKFCYTFLACIISWLDGGTDNLVAQFLPGPNRIGHFVVEAKSGEDAIQDGIVPHLLSLLHSSEATHPIVDVDANRFEVDENRYLFSNGADAVRAFGEAVKIPLDRSMSAIAMAQWAGPSTAAVEREHRKTALRYWGFKIGRGLLLSAGEGVEFSFVNRAFGGIVLHHGPSEGRSQQDVDTNEPDEQVMSFDVVHPPQGPIHTPAAESNGELSQDLQMQDGNGGGSENEGLDDVPELIRASGVHDTVASRDLQTVLEDLDATISEGSEDDDDGYDYDHLAPLLNEDDEQITFRSDEGEGEEDGAYDESDDDENDDAAVDDSNDESNGEGQESDSEDFDPGIIFGRASSLGRFREAVEADVPCANHTRVYRGHCNVKTVKDVNFYGLDDEYVVSGSDSGHLFIWDRKTQQLLNILQGDGEVVNVVQGHPYEPMLAVSGIDHTIKIFSPDQRAQTDARRGIGLGTNARRAHGVRSVHLRSRLGRGVAATAATAASPSEGNSGTQTPSAADPVADAAAAAAAWDDDSIEGERPSNGGLASCRRMQDSYAITHQNDVDRQGGLEDAFFTRDTLELLAAHIRARQMARVARQNGAGGGDAGAGAGDEEDEEGERTIVVDDNCSVM